MDQRIDFIAGFAICAALDYSNTRELTRQLLEQHTSVTRIPDNYHLPGTDLGTISLKRDNDKRSIF
ncbi:MAG: hypothetical protein JXQ99_25895 [Hyphomicrobiaceae bacterium]